MKQMSKKQHNIGLDYIQRVIDLKKIDPSPYQLRKHFDEDKLKELAATIRREGLIGPLVVRLNGGRYELIAGERRLRAVRDYMGIKDIPAKVVNGGVQMLLQGGHSLKSRISADSAGQRSGDEVELAELLRTQRGG